MSGTATVTDALRAAGVPIAEGGDGAAVGGSAPDCVAEPRSVDEVRAVLDLARAADLAVVPLGHGTEPGPGAPHRRFVVLSTVALAGIEAYEPADLTLTAGAGTAVTALVDATAAHGQWLPFDPPRLSHRTLGGLVATGTSGPLTVAFGGVRDHVLGVTLVSGTGKVLRLGGRVMKNVAGFDLVRAVVGSRGALGVVVSATVRLFPAPETDRTTVVPATDPDALLELARRVRTAAVVPAAAVLAVRDGSAALLVRVLGAAAAVPVESALLLGEPAGVEVHEGPESTARLGEALDAPDAHDIVVRATALASELPAVLSAVGEALPGATIGADVLTGRLRLGVDGPVEPPTLMDLRARLVGMGGSLTLERAPDELVRAVGGPPTTAAAAIEDALRCSFDPHGTLRRERRP